MTALNDYIIITWSPLCSFVSFLISLIKHSLAKVSHRQKAGRGCGGGRVKDHRLLFIQYQLGCVGRELILRVKYLSLSFLKSLTLSWAGFGRRNGKRLQCGFSSLSFPRDTRLLFRTVPCTMGPTHHSNWGIYSMCSCVCWQGPGEQMARDIMCCRQEHRDRVAGTEMQLDLITSWGGTIVS